MSNIWLSSKNSYFESTWPNSLAKRQMILIISKTKSRNRKTEILKTKHFWILMIKWLKILKAMLRRLMNWMIWQIKSLMLLMNTKDDYLTKLLWEWWDCWRKDSRLKRGNLISWRTAMELITEHLKRRTRTLNRRQPKSKRFEFRIKKRSLRLKRSWMPWI